MTDAGDSPAPDVADALGTHRVIVIGSGLAAAVAARELARPGFEVTLVQRAAASPVDASTSPTVATVRDGALAALLEALGLHDHLRPERAETHRQARAIAVPAGRHDVRVVAEPDRSILGMPASPLASDVVAAIGRRGALRAYLDRFRPVLTIGQEGRFDRLVRSRLGGRALEQLVTPAARARFGAGPGDLDVARAVPGLNPALTRLGTLSGAVGELLGDGEEPDRALMPGGTAWLRDQVVADAVRRGADVRGEGALKAHRAEDGAEVPAVSAVSVRRSDGDDSGAASSPWLVELAEGDLEADVIVLATDPDEARGLTGVDPDPSLLMALSHVFLTVPAATMVKARWATVLGSPSLPGSPVVADDLTARFATDETEHCLHLRYGTDDVPGLQGICRAASVLFGVELTPDAVSDVRTVTVPTPYHRALRGRGDAIRRTREALERFGVTVTGPWLAGTDPADVVEHASEAARRVRTDRWRSLDVRS